MLELREKNWQSRWAGFGMNLSRSVRVGESSSRAENEIQLFWNELEMSRWHLSAGTVPHPQVSLHSSVKCRARHNAPWPISNAGIKWSESSDSVMCATHAQYIRIYIHTHPGERMLLNVTRFKGSLPRQLYILNAGVNRVVWNENSGIVLYIVYIYMRLYIIHIYIGYIKRALVILYCWQRDEPPFAPGPPAV